MPDQKQIVEAIADNLGLPITDIDTESSLQDDLSLNPIEVADLFNSLSHKFDITFEPQEPGSIKTVGDLVEIIEDKLLE